MDNKFFLKKYTVKSHKKHKHWIYINIGKLDMAKLKAFENGAQYF